MKRSRRESGFLRAYGAKALDNAEACALAAWRALAQAGAPHGPKSERPKRIALATESFDQARGHLSAARRDLDRIVAGIQAAEARQKARPPAERGYSDGPNPADKASVTTLRPRVEALTHDLGQLGAVLTKYRGGETRRPIKSYEREVAGRFEPWMSERANPPQLCAWCGKLEEKYDAHVALDGAGYAGPRAEGRRFCCRSCFYDGRDLAEPSPKPLPVQEPAPPGPRLLPGQASHAAHLSDCTCPDCSDTVAQAEDHP